MIRGIEILDSIIFPKAHATYITIHDHIIFKSIVSATDTFILFLFRLKITNISLNRGFFVCIDFHFSPAPPMHLPCYDDAVAA